MPTVQRVLLLLRVECGGVADEERSLASGEAHDVLDGAGRGAAAGFAGGRGLVGREDDVVHV